MDARARRKQVVNAVAWSFDRHMWTTCSLLVDCFQAEHRAELTNYCTRVRVSLSTRQYAPLALVLCAAPLRLQQAYPCSL
jgi:hypothetical protein